MFPSSTMVIEKKILTELLQSNRKTLFLVSMQKYSCVYLIFLVLSLASCSTAVLPTKSTTHMQPTLLHPLYFQDEVSAMLNFPFWFQDSILKQQHIQSCTITTYGSSSSSEEEVKKTPFPKKSVCYTFDHFGHLIHIQLTDFFEGIIISHQSFQIIPSSNSYYFGVKRLDNTYGIENNSYLIVPFKTKKNVVQFDNNMKSERLHYIENKAFWGALSVDSITNAKPTDWIILGTPKRPEKRYRVKNTVTERNVTHYTYYNSNFPNVTISEDYPFTKKRTFLYNRAGLFTGYIDSTFIDAIFVTRGLNYIHYDKDKKPTLITHSKGHADGANSYRSKELITYTFYK